MTPKCILWCSKYIWCGGFGVRTGGYALILDLEDEVRLSAGKKSFLLQSSTYVYSGSALNGLKNRVRRHTRTWRQSLASGSMKKHWHIDYLLPLATAMTTVCAQTEFRTECLLVEFLVAKGFTPIKGFGSSDCRRCTGHLLQSPYTLNAARSASHEKTVTSVLEAFRAMGLNDVARHSPSKSG